MTLKTGDFVVYGPDPRINGFPLDNREIGQVRSIYVGERGVTYAKVSYPHRPSESGSPMLKSWPEDMLTVIERQS